MIRLIYIASFTLLGILLQFLAHALIEVRYIGLLVADFPKYGFGYTWESWVLLHNILTGVFFIAGAWIGYREGIYWWRMIYEENMISEWRNKIYGSEWKSKMFPIFVSVISVVSVMMLLHYFYPLTTIEQPEELFSSNNSHIWNTYRNEKYGFELKYPPDWQLSAKTIDNCGAHGCNILNLMKYSANQKESDLDFHGGVSMSFTTMDSLDDKTRKLVDYYLLYSTGKSYFSNGFQGSMNRDTDFSGTVYRELSGGEFLMIDWQRVGTSPEDIEFDAILEKILSTFKFIEPHSKIDTSTWRTYRNEEYGFEFKYPQDRSVTISDKIDAPSGTAYDFIVQLNDTSITEGMTGQEARGILQTVHILVQNYSPKALKLLTDSIAENYSQQKSIGLETRKETIYYLGGNTDLYYLWSGLIGTQLNAVIHNERYTVLFSVDTENGKELMMRIISTFKFIK